MSALRFGVHLPQIDFGDQAFPIDRLVDYVDTAISLGFDAIAANDHLLFTAPWLDGPTTLAAVIGCSGEAELFTTIANPVVRGPMPLAKSLSAIDVLSGGRLVAALGPGSSANDYRSVGLPFEQRWPRFDEAVAATRAILRGGTFSGRFYDVGDEHVAPVHGDGPPLWIGSWGSAVGLRRVARLGDGWLASAYHMTAGAIEDGRRRLSELLAADDRDPTSFPIAVATMWFHLDSPERADRVLRERVVPATNRAAEMLAPRLAFGPPEAVAQTLGALHAAGAARVFLWPVSDEINQLRRFAEEVMPLLAEK